MVNIPGAPPQAEISGKGPTGTSPGGPSAKKKGMGKKMLIIPVLLVAVAVFFIFGPGGQLIGGKGKEGGSPAAKKQVELPEAVIDLGEFVLNLSTPADTQQTRYVKVTIALGVDSEGTAEYVKVREAYFKDIIVERFSQATPGELSSTQGRTTLRNELKGQFTELLPEGAKVERVLFTQLAFQ